jgi:hypothetical protein
VKTQRPKRPRQPVEVFNILHDPAGLESALRLQHALMRAALQARGRQPDDPVTLPFWAFEEVRRLADLDLQQRANQRRPSRTTSLLHWQRYAYVHKALAEGRAKWESGRAGEPDVYEVVTADLANTKFAGGPWAIKKSYERVAAAIKRGDHTFNGRFFFQSLKPLS